MTLRGGGADKLGNRYEGLWTVREMLSVLDEHAQSIALERPGEDGKGVEFALEAPEGTLHYQVKRRNRDQWTLGDLDREGVLGTFYKKLDDPTARVVFASTHQADALANLTERARKSSSYREFTELFSNKQLDNEFETLRSKWNNCSPEAAWERLRRIQVRASDDHTLEGFLHGLLVERIEGDPVAVRVLLADYAVERMHEKAITAAEIWAYLEQRGFRRRAWYRDPRVISRMEAVTDGYLAALEGQAIGAHWMERSEVATLQERLDSLTERRCVVLSGEAGIGKSGVVYEAVRAFKAKGWPILAFRLDRLEPADTPRNVGVRLDLPESPANVLAAVAHGRDAILVIDQLDAVSITSGRNPMFFECVLAMIREALHRPNLRVLVACRRFDLHNDHRFLGLLKERVGIASELQVGRLTADQVSEALHRFGLDPARFSTRQTELLSSPLNLKLFAEGLGAGGEHAPFESVNDLYRTFWDRKQQALRLASDRSVNWVGVIDALCQRMSESQLLSVPEYQFDGLEADWKAMASEGVLVQDGQRIAFFHEGFFDYAFARRFAAKGGDLLGLLLESEQHLFRRAQVRQILLQKRAVDFPRYLEHLEKLLSDGRIRFHIRQGVLALLGTFQDPTEAEWKIIAALLGSQEGPEVQEVWLLLQNAPAWFALLDRLGALALWLASDDEATLNRTVWLLQFAKSHSPNRVAELARPFLDASPEWNQRLRALFRFNGIPEDRGLFELFLSLFERGGFDQDDFWMLVHDLPKQRPDWACEAIGLYLQKVIEPMIATPSEERLGLRGRYSLPDSHYDDNTIKACAEHAAPTFLENVLPFVKRVAAKTVRSTGQAFESDDVWGYRYFYEQHPTLAENILDGVITALRVLSKSDLISFKTYFNSLKLEPFETIQFILIRALTGASEKFADDALDLLCECTERFQIGFSDGSEHASYELLAAMTPHAADTIMLKLERAIMGYYPELTWNMGDNKNRYWKALLKTVGKAQLALLMGVNEMKLTPAMRRRKQELERKFPNLKTVEPRIRGGFVGSPISQNAASRMTDGQWLNAMSKYRSDDMDVWHDNHIVGGAQQLAHTLTECTKANAPRFARLALVMPDTLHESYFEAILIGLEKAELDPALVFAVVRRCHALPNRPCGRWISQPVARVSESDIPDDVLELVAWYATDDPNPGEDRWKTSQDGGARETSNKILTEGINSVRGTAAESVGSLIFDQPERLRVFMPTVQKLMNDPIVAVRCCAAETLVGILKHDRDLAVQLFLQLCTEEDALLATPPVEHFLWYAIHTHYPQLEPLLKRMLHSAEPEVAQVGARLISISAFLLPEAASLAQACLNGTTPQRLGAAEVYAENFKSPKYSSRCEGPLQGLFHDTEEAVRDKAADCFWRVPDGILEQSNALVESFLSSPAFEHDRHLLYTLEASALKMPDVLLTVCECTLGLLGKEARDIRTRAAGDAHIVNRLAVRIYAQQLNASVPDADVTRRSLDLIDHMLAMHVFDADKLLELFER